VVDIIYHIRQTLPSWDQYEFIPILFDKTKLN